jgi:hypothetical protein
VGQRERGQPCQCARMVKCRLEDREFGCQQAAGEADPYQVKASVGDRCVEAFAIADAGMLRPKWSLLAGMLTFLLITIAEYRYLVNRMGKAKAIADSRALSNSKPTPKI